MAIDLSEGIGALSLTRCQKDLHLLSCVQRQTAPSRSRTEGPTRAELTITDGKLHFDERFARLLDGCPTRTDPPLWAGHRLSLPIDGEVSEIIAGLRLIPVGSDAWDQPDLLHSELAF